MFLKMINYLPPELTYSVSHAFINAGIVRVPGVKLEFPVELGKLRVKNPIGLGAGIDKDGLLVGSIANSGVGFVTIGSVTLRPRLGNPKPRIVKYPHLKAMVNAMGLPSRGFMDFMSRINNIIKVIGKFNVSLVVSLAGFSIEEFLIMLNRLRNFDIHAVEINISSPTYHGSWVSDPKYLSELLNALEDFDTLFFIKTPLGVGLDFYKWIAHEAEKHGYGLTIANTLPVSEPRISVGYGGLSGYPIYPLVKALIRRVRAWGFRGPVIGLGGVFHGWQVIELLRSGANLVAVVTAFAYEGPFVFNRLLREFVSLSVRF
ncbi:MAG: dihydroorotate dehydrogenase [Vulcanisaeta sp.]